MRYLKLAFVAALLAVAAIALLRVAGVLPAEDMNRVLGTTMGGIAILALAAVAIGFFSKTSAPSAPDDKPVP